jgi:hypothetical protein
VIEVNRALNGDASLFDLQVVNPADQRALVYQPDFAPDTLNYTLSVANEISRVNLRATVNNRDATVLGQGLKDLVIGVNNFSLTVTAQDGTTREYRVSITRAESSEARLASLSLDQAAIAPTFYPDNLLYTARVPFAVTDVAVFARPLNADATVTITGGDNLIVGDNLIQISVVSQDQTATREYQILVTRASEEAEAAKSPYLANLATNLGDWDQPFARDRFAYTVTVPSDAASITLSGAPEEPTATTTGLGTFPLTADETVFQVVNQIDSTNLATYTLTVRRVASSEARLANLSVAGAQLTPGFNPDGHLYTTTVQGESAVIAATPLSAKATVAIPAADHLALGANTFTITVTAEDGTLGE